MHKLSLDERELLQELSTHPSLKVLLKELEACTASFEERVIKFDLGSAKDTELELVRIKCRAEGARSLFSAIKQRLEAAKPKPPLAKP